MASVPKDVPKDLQRLATEIDGWLDLRCPDKALERLQPLLDRPDARAAGLVLRVRAAVALKQHREALADIRELRQLDYDPEWLELTEAWCRKRLQDLPGAIDCMRRLLRADPRSAIGHFNLGCYLALAGEREQALDEVTLACGFDESYRDLLYTEPDLASLHKDERLLKLAAKAENDEQAPGNEEDEHELDDLDESADLDEDADDESSAPSN